MNESTITTVLPPRPGPVGALRNHIKEILQRHMSAPWEYDTVPQKHDPHHETHEPVRAMLRRLTKNGVVIIAHYQATPNSAYVCRISRGPRFAEFDEFFKDVHE